MHHQREEDMLGVVSILKIKLLAVVVAEEELLVQILFMREAIVDVVLMLGEASVVMQGKHIIVTHHQLEGRAFRLGMWINYLHS